MMSISKFLNIWRLMSQYTFDLSKGSLNENLSCLICKKIMIDACQSACGCQYCRNCINEYLKDEDKYCPGGKLECNEDILVKGQDITRNRVINNKIYNLKVICPNDFCRSSVQLAQMDEHLQMCTKQSFSCPYNVVGCNEERFSKDSILSHLCKETLSHAKLLCELINNLNNEMTGLKVRADSSYVEAVILKEGLKKMNEAVQQVHAEIEVVKDLCELKDNKIMTLERESTNKENRIVGLERYSRKKDAELREVHTQLAIIREDAEQKRSVILSLERNCVNTENQVREMRHEMKGLKKENVARKEEFRAVKGAVDVLSRQWRTDKGLSSPLVVRKIKRESEQRGAVLVKRKRKSMQEDVLVPPVAVLEAGSQADVGGVTVIVDRFSARREGERIVSECVYTHRGGYKLRLVVLPRQYGPWLSVCFVVCRGEYDRSLQWPCPWTVTLALENQATMATEHAVTVSHGSLHPRCKYLFLQPAADKDNHPYECRLIRHESLRAIPGLLVDDRVVIKCVLSQ